MIRVPVAHINGLSQTFIERYRAERERGPFESLDEFVERCRPGEAESQLLLDSGALDALGESRPALFWQLRRLLRTGEANDAMLWSERRGSGPLLNGSSGSVIEKGPDPFSSSPPVELTEPDPWRIARREMELLGFPITIDPLTFLGRDDSSAGGRGGRDIDWSRYVPVNRLHEHLGRRVVVCGLIVADRVNRATTGDLMKFVTLGDRTGFVETCLFPDAYQRFGHLTVAHPILAATGVVEPFENKNGFTLRVTRVAPAERCPGSRPPAAARPACPRGSAS
jgi:DNA polymerase III alpha subunit